MNKIILTSCIICLSIIPSLSFAQDSSRTAYDGFLVPTVVVDGENLPVFTLPEVPIYANDMSAKELKRYQKLVRDVKKVYPYAKIAREIFQKYSDILANVSSEKEKDKIMEQVESELKKEYEGIIKDLTVRQGKILIKLVDRETTHTSFEIIEDFRGTFSAFLWQQLALLFGSNLKKQYDAEGEDMMIENIIAGIEGGWL